jgi:tetratricopeptide (TPR) repeat protein
MGPAGNLAFVRPLLRARDWQDRPQFAHVCQWWRKGGIGVCALIGIGGAGKTATAERFLQVLPGAFPEHPRARKDATLQAPKRLFVFSFYDVPNADMFFDDVGAWLTGERNLAYAKIADTLMDPPRDPSERLLLVLDGLEKVQDDGTRGGTFGQISDGRLRNLVLQVSDGWLPHVSLLITSRFRLFDPLQSRTYYFQQIDVERLELSAAIRLLRARNVRGTDDQLERVATELGLHALSVDLAAGYIQRFGDGLATRWSSFETEDSLDLAALDPAVAAVLQQERTFTRLASRYHETLAANDPAALALLQHICLFRLGVDVNTLAADLLGAERELIAGPALSRLTAKQLKTKLQLLAEMRLIEATQTEPLRYTIHPAVRDGFASKLSAEATRVGHQAAYETLQSSLGGAPGRFAVDSVALDQLEEIVYHMLAAGRGESAWEIYRTRIGAYANLGHRLGAFERGQRICRMFAENRRPEDAPRPEALPAVWHGSFLNGWALYLDKLGELQAAIQCFEKAAECDRNDPVYRSIELRNLAATLAAAGLLKRAHTAATEAYEAVRNHVDEQRSAFAYRTYIEALRGFLRFGSGAFRNPHASRHGIESIMGAMYFLRLRRPDDAARWAKATHGTGSQQYGDDHIWSGECDLVLAGAAQQEGDTELAREYLETAHEWALQRDAKRLLCWSACARAAIEMDEGDFDAASTAVEEGLRIARECGYGLHHIDLLLLRARLELQDGCAEDAKEDIRIAIDEGVHPPVESGFPELLAANDPECGYAWAIARGHHLMAETLLLQAAQRPDEAAELELLARDELNAALARWRELRDPDGDDELHPDGERTLQTLASLESGVLTEYPIAAKVLPQEPVTVVQPAAKNRHAVFISYAHADNEPPKKWLQRVLLHLKPLVRQEDLVVWCDQQLKGGDEWRGQIRQHLEEATVAVLLVTPAYLASEFVANQELPVLLRRAHTEGVRILPVLVAPSSVHRTRFGPEEFRLTNFQTIGTPSRTLADMSEADQDRVLSELAERILEIRSAVE